MVFMRQILAIALTCAFFVAYAIAVLELVVLEEPQLAQRLEGVVVDPSGAPILDMIVTDRTENGVAVLHTTQTGNEGHFHFPTQRGRQLLSSLRSSLVESAATNAQARQACSSTR